MDVPGSVTRVGGQAASLCGSAPFGKESLSSGATAQAGETAEGGKGERGALVNHHMEYWDYVQRNVQRNNIYKLKHVPFQVIEGVSLLKKRSFGKQTFFLGEKKIIPFCI